MALLKLSFDLEFNDYVYPTVLSDSVTAGGLEATVVGWGLNSSEGIVQEILQEANIYTVSNEDCKNIHQKPIHLENICAMYPEGGRGQCNGDSGGPLYIDGIQVGVVSWSIKPCTIAPYPGVFTDITYFRDWIKSVTEE